MSQLVRVIVWDEENQLQRISNPEDIFLIEAIEASGSDDNVMRIGALSSSAILIGRADVATFVSGVLSGNFITGTFYGDASQLRGAVNSLNAFTGSVRLLAGTNIVINSASGDITISATLPAGSGEANTASNVGTGTGLFKQKSGVDLEFKSLTAGRFITINGGANDVAITGTGLPMNGILVVDKTHPGADFTTIQAAINAASPGTTILVGSGTFIEALTLKDGIRIVGRTSDHQSDDCTTVYQYYEFAGGDLVSTPSNTSGYAALEGIRFVADTELGSGLTVRGLYSDRMSVGLKDCRVEVTSFAGNGPGGSLIGVLMTGSNTNAPGLFMEDSYVAASDPSAQSNTLVNLWILGKAYVESKNSYVNGNVTLSGSATSKPTLEVYNSRFSSFFPVTGTVTFHDVVSILTTGSFEWTDTQTLVQNKAYNLLWNNGQNELYKLNLKPLAGDPGSVSDGDVWYDNVTKRLQVRESGTTYDMLQVRVTASDPTNLQEGDMWYNSTNKVLRAYQSGSVMDVIFTGTVEAAPDTTKGHVFKTAGQTNATATGVDVTDMFFSMSANTDYGFHFRLVASASLATVGIQMAVSGNRALEQLDATIVGWTSTTAQATTAVNAIETYQANTAGPGTTSRIFEIFGAVRNGASSDSVLRVRFRSENTNPVTIGKGSWGTWFKA